MRKNNKKNLLIIILIITIIILSLIVAFLKIFHKEKNSIDEFSKDLQKNITTINNINNQINNENLENEVNYTLLDNIECRQYIGDNPKEFMNLIEKTYIKSFYDYGLFNLVQSGEEKKLYVCLPKTCKMKKITNYEIISEDENIKVISFDGIRYVMSKDNDTWKFIYPVFLCENTEPIEY